MNEQAMMMNQHQQQLMNMNPSLTSLNQMNPQQLPQSQSQMLPINLSYGVWPPHLQPQPQPPFQKPNPNVGAMNPLPSTFKNRLGPRSSWKGKRVNKPNDKRRKEQHKSLMVGNSGGGGLAGGVNTVGGGAGNLKFSNYNLPTLNELQYQNRLKTRKFFPKKKFNQNNNMNMNIGYNNNNHYSNSRSAPFAPRNTTSFLIRAKKSGGIASLVSPCPVTPAVLPTPIFSPSREVLVDMAKEEWGVDGYGSMKGLIRLRSPGHETETQEDEEDDDGGSSESDVEEHVEVERRLDHDLSRFEMIYNPQSVGVGGMEYHNVLENQVDDQDTHISQLEEENMILKERLFLMEREIGEMTRRLRCLERRGGHRVEDHEEVVENESDDGSDSHEYVHSMEENNDEFCEEVVRECGFSRNNEDNDKNDVFYKEVENKEMVFEADKHDNITDPECKIEKNIDQLVAKNKDQKIIVHYDDIEQNNEDMNKCTDVEVKAGDIID